MRLWIRQDNKHIICAKMVMIGSREVFRVSMPISDQVRLDVISCRSQALYYHLLHFKIELYNEWENEWVSKQKVNSECETTLPNGLYIFWWIFTEDSHLNNNDEKLRHNQNELYGYLCLRNEYTTYSEVKKVKKSFIFIVSSYGLTVVCVRTTIRLVVIQ